MGARAGGGYPEVRVGKKKHNAARMKSMVPPRLSVVENAEHDVGPVDVKAPVERSVEPAEHAAHHGLPANIAALPSADRRDKLRTLEALLFAAAEPLAEEVLGRRLGIGAEVSALLDELKGFYASRGINLVRVAGKWAFRTAPDLAYLLEQHASDERRLSKAALETLAIIAYHQPVTRAEIEEVRGVTTSKGTLDVLLEIGWIRPRGRRRAPGKPVTYGTTDAFLVHFGLDTIKDLPGLAELKGAGLLDSSLPPDFKVPEPTDVAALMPDELPLEDAEEDTTEQAQLEFAEDTPDSAEDEQDQPT
jgi:segregation and condensation protein B